MALINPSTLYSGGNVRLDSSPYLRLALQERARKEARAYALDQYYQRLPETINDKGVRNQEVPIISDLKNQMAETWMKNKEAIRKGDPNAQMQMQQLFRKAMAVTRESQNASKIDMQAATIALNKDNQDLINSDDFILRHENHNRPVTDPQYQPLDISAVMANKPFNQQQFMKEIKGNFKYGEGIPTITPHPTDKTLDVVTTNPVLDDNTKQQIYGYAAQKYHNDKSFERALRKEYQTPEQVAPLNEVSKNVFGHEIKTPEDLAAAYTVSLLPETTVKTSVRTNLEDQRKFQDEQMQKRFRHQEAMVRMNDRLIRKRKVDGVDEVEVGYPTNELDTEFGEDVPLQDSTGKDIGIKRIIYVDEIPVGTHRGINPRDDNKGIYPVKPKSAKQPNGKYRDYYEVEKDENGNINFVGAKDKKIGAEDARNNFIKEVVPTKVKLNTVTNKPVTKKGKYD